jgi:arylsulfatase A-like enzyme
MKQMMRLWMRMSALLVAFSVCAANNSNRPNVILVMTDDQGYGDLGCHGNPVLKTPEIDTLYAESIRLTDFHVSSFCTPTRGALMTGRDPGHNGAYRTSSGRTMLHPDEKTVANLFADNGYVTGMAGKWHLGDNAPHRPQDHGFQDAVWHRCGGVGQASDYWGNDYFDDTYERVKPGSKVGTFEKFTGYCTDVFFREGLRFVEENRDKPFFLYLAPNAPHGPYYVAPEWAAPYQREDVYNPNFYGMIANLDYNMGILRKTLEKLGLAENTILIFMTDNGTAAGAGFKGLTSEAVKGYNAGMRGKKSSIYEGGHRVPFFIYWPNGSLTGGRDVDTLAAHYDVLPTLAELCGLDIPSSYNLDGRSLVPLLKDRHAPWDRDHLVMQFHGGAGFSYAPCAEKDSYVMTERWRLLDGLELYDMEADPAQRKDVASEHPEVVAQLRAIYQPYWDSVAPRMTPVRIDLGNPTDNPAVLCSQDWYMPKGNPPWSFGLIQKLPKVTAPWMVDVKRAGRYRMTLRQWPAEANKPVIAVRAKVVISGQEQEGPVMSGCQGVVIEMDLPAGPSELWTYLYDETGNAGGAYFTDVEWLGESGSLPEAPAAPQSAGSVPVTRTPGTGSSRVGFPERGATSWAVPSFDDAKKAVWDGENLSGMTLRFSGNNFGYNDSMKAVDFSGSTIYTTGNQPFLFVDLTGADFSGATLNLAGFEGRMSAFREAKLADADFSSTVWGVSTDGLTEKTDFFFNGGPGSTSAADRHRAVTFEGADLSRITGAARAAMIRHLGKFDGATAIGAQVDQAMLTKSGWSAAELAAAGWQIR